MDQKDKLQICAQLLLLLAAVTIQDVEFMYKETLLLNCNGTDGTNGTNATWWKDSISVTKLNYDGVEFEALANGSLQIKNAIRDIAGVYTCQCDCGNKTETIYAAAKVVPFETSMNLEQGDMLNITCRVLGYPLPSITWLKDGIELHLDSRYQLSEFSGFPNASLAIKSVDFGDAGVYTCQASSSRYNISSSETIIIRVKDKLAPLWPLLGIVVEVVVLSVIIFVFEKKGNRISNTEEDDSKESTTKEKKSKGVRHRGNANNPKS